MPLAARSSAPSGPQRARRCCSTQERDPRYRYKRETLHGHMKPLPVEDMDLKRSGTVNRAKRPIRRQVPGTTDRRDYARPHPGAARGWKKHRRDRAISRLQPKLGQAGDGAAAGGERG